MRFCSQSRSADRNSDEASTSAAENLAAGGEQESALIKTIGWISAGLGAVALGLFVGRELRLRYKFNHRTPYDFYAHAGDEEDVDFGLGI
ncbi:MULTISPECIES: hypothetical protein [Acidobacteriaceae]|uniref:hypothetical protein n=1 Tax=Acidobacteriaceae TaxID=204434 RepID=UPI001C20C175|nr:MULTISPECIES: hypothetical protein [Acidobacteriaceae]MDW5267382.1 hypothetical protein [Edaphobacter sp.]